MSQKELSILARRGLWPAVTGLTAIVALVSAGLGLHSLRAEASDVPTASAPQAIPVSVATVAESDVAGWNEFSGRLEAVERVDVRSRVAGAVQAVHFKEGALVKQGADLLPRLGRPWTSDDFEQAIRERADKTVDAATWGHLRNIVDAARQFAFVLGAAERGDDPDIPF